jgi:hypothetical protein
MHRHLRKIAIAGLLTISSIAGVAGLASRADAAVSPGAFNSADCDPNTRTITHRMEMYRSAGELVYVRSALNNNGTFSFGPWLNLDWAGQAKQVWNAARGNYSVWMQYAIYNPYTRTYSYAQQQVPAIRLQTFGRPLGSGIYTGGGIGYCSI